MSPIKNVLIPTKGDDVGEDAFRLACGICKENKAKLYALYVIEVKQELPLDAEVDPRLGENILGRIEALGSQAKCPVAAEYVQARHSGPAIVQEALERKIDLIILGIPYKRRLGQFTLGDTASYALKNAPCPVILWRERTAFASPVGAYANADHRLGLRQYGFAPRKFTSRGWTQGNCHG